MNLLKRIADSGEPLKALFICDRDELRTQASGAFQNVFGSDAAPVSVGKNRKNARVLIATYQTLDVGSDDADANFLTTNYPENYFTHIVIDECHRSAWGKWSQVLARNPNAVQVGLTATPRQLTADTSDEAAGDAQITADNVRHFGEPVYEYEIGQGIEDGYLAACEIHLSHRSGRAARSAHRSSGAATGQHGAVQWVRGRSRRGQCARCARADCGNQQTGGNRHVEERWG